MTMPTDDNDPRTSLSDDDLALARDTQEPVVARPNAAAGLLPVIAVFIVAAVGLFVFLNSRRTEAAPNSIVAVAPGAVMSAPEPPLQLPPSPTDQTLTSDGLAALTAMAPTPIANFQTAPVFVTTASALPAMAAPPVDPTARRRAPTVVVDIDGASPRGASLILAADGPAAASTRATPLGAAGAAAAAAAAGGQQPSGLSANEAFAERLATVGGSDRAVARSIGNLAATVPQGAMIPGVLETAINSDLPGFTRAVVSRDVMSFDGRHVLIPRGSRLIGQYKSAVALGQSRAFVIWTRVIRPDGVSVDIGSPGADQLGRGGLDGEVDRHFFERFSGSILLSLLDAGVRSLGSSPTTQIAIGSPGAASSVASSAMENANLPPTITVRQGEAIRIFVARDLDFSNVGPAR